MIRMGAMSSNKLREHLRQRDWDGVADLSRDCGFAASPEIVVRKPLKPGCLKVRKGAILRRMKVPPLLRLEKLGSNCDRRFVPMETSHDVTRACLVAHPTWSQQVRRQIVTIASWR